VIDDLEDKNVCHFCVSEAHLSAEIAQRGEPATCDYCGEEQNHCVNLSWLALRVDPIYRELVAFGEPEPFVRDDSDNIGWSTTGDKPSTLITELIDCVDEEIAEDIVTFLGHHHAFAIGKDGDTDWYDESSDTYVIELRPDPRFRHAWQAFCQSLKHKRRFFSADAKTILDDILGPILKGTSSDFAGAIRVIGPDSEDRFIYRGRLANDEVSRRAIYTAPIGQLGAPPPEFSAAGRMNTAGISVFYASTDAKTCAAELRAPVGGGAVVGRFEIIRPLRILDLTRLETFQNTLSKFHPDFFKAHGYGLFMRGFHAEIRKPILPGQETLEYLPTQVVAEYLWTRREHSIDGLIFGSAQVSGSETNIVLFPHASAVEGAEAEQVRTVANVYNLGGYAGPDEPPEEESELITLKPWIPPEKPSFTTYPIDEFGNVPFATPAERPAPALRLDPSQITRVHVKAICYDLKSIPVRREDEEEWPF